MLPTRQRSLVQSETIATESFSPRRQERLELMSNTRYSPSLLFERVLYFISFHFLTSHIFYFCRYRSSESHRKFTTEWAI